MYEILFTPEQFSYLCHIFIYYIHIVFFLTIFSTWYRYKTFIQYQKKKRKKRKAPSKRKSSVLKEKTNKNNTIVEQSKKTSNVHKHINWKSNKKQDSYMIFSKLHIYISGHPFITCTQLLFVCTCMSTVTISTPSPNNFKNSVCTSKHEIYKFYIFIHY